MKWLPPNLPGSTGANNKSRQSGGTYIQLLPAPSCTPSLRCAELGNLGPACSPAEPVRTNDLKCCARSQSFVRAASHFSLSDRACCISSVVDRYHHQALKCYNQAIGHFKPHVQQKPRDSLLTLLSCILFMCIEFQRDTIANALALLGQGFKLLPKGFSNEGEG